MKLLSKASSRIFDSNDIGRQKTKNYRENVKKRPSKNIAHSDTKEVVEKNSRIQVPIHL